MEFVSMQTQRYLKSGHITEIFGASLNPPHDGWYEITQHADKTVTLTELILLEANRWAAFTEDELTMLSIEAPSELEAEILAELERRKSAG